MNGTNIKNKDNIPLNGKVTQKIRNHSHSGDIIYEGEDVQNRYSPQDYYLMSFPMEEIYLYLKETLIILKNNRKRETNIFELYKLFEIMVLIA